MIGRPPLKTSTPDRKPAQAAAAGPDFVVTQQNLAGANPDAGSGAQADVRQHHVPVALASPGVAGPVTLLAALALPRTGAVQMRGAELDRHVQRLLARLDAACAAFRGKVLSKANGEMIATFDDPATALRAACRMQSNAAELPPAFGLRHSLRIAFDRLTAHGQLIEPTQTAEALRRLIERARRGQVVTRRVLAALLPPELHEHLRARDRKHDRAGADALCEVQWRELDAIGEAGTSRSKPVPATKAALMRLVYRDLEFHFSPGILPLTIGRGSECAVRVKGEHVSRQHVKVGWESGQFVLTDISLNGTLLRVPGFVDCRLKGSGLTLAGRGAFVCSHSEVRATDQWLSFEVMSTQANA